MEIRTIITTADGLPSNDVLSVAVGKPGEIFAGTSRGLAFLKAGKWTAVQSLGDAVPVVAHDGNGVVAATKKGVWRVDEDGAGALLAPLPPEANDERDLRSIAGGKSVLLGTRVGLFELKDGAFTAVESLNNRLSTKDIRQVASDAAGNVAIAADDGLFLRTRSGQWEQPPANDGVRRWLPIKVRGVAFDPVGRLWFASPAGVGALRGKTWSLYGTAEGLPYNDFTTAAAGESGIVWFGTGLGAIRFDGLHWSYRQGKRWLPDDAVRAIAVEEDGNAWFATAHGLGRIERKPMTLAEKAAYFESQIDKYHRRTPYGYVLEVNLSKPGDVSNVQQHDSDNDGLWTSMYGAGECFAYAATKDPLAKKRAKAAFEALKFLSDVTQGGEHSPPKGFPARSILPTSGPDPNVWDSPERDRRQQQREPLWKVMSPRWPKSADGKWYWKSDTSSDELDGHYFLYAAYYDLVAETETEKEPVRQVVRDITGHLVDHDFDLIDHDGKPTRWARFGPKTLNQVRWAEGRGLNSLSILSYLAVADHVTGENRFKEAFDRLVREHAYLTNLIFAKAHTGPGTGNQSDDEMAFMSYYDLFKYAKDPEVQRAATLSIQQYWAIEEPERSPLFNFLYASCIGRNPRSARWVPTTILADGVDFLKRFPLDRIDWDFKNSHRLDVVKFDRFPGRFYRHPRGHLPNGQTLPIDERFIEHWNYDAWTLDGGSGGRSLADGTAFLLPYYLGRYLGYVVEEPPTAGSSPKISKD